MAGNILRVLRKTDFDVSGLGSGLSNTITVARRLDASRWREGVLMARLHSTAAWPSSATIQIFALLDAYTDDDPALVWNVPGAAALITFTQGTDTPPSDKVASIVAPFGPLIQIQITFANAVGVSGTYKPSLSIDLDLKGN